MTIVNLLLAGAVMLSGGLAIRGEGFSYLDFAGPVRLIFQADALPTNGVGRLTPSARSKVGGMWFEDRLLVRDGFETTFQFQITNPRTYGADGFAFVIQSNPTPSLGKPGWQLGFGGIANSLVVKFDNYHWRDKIHLQYDEIAVSVCGESGDCDPDKDSVAAFGRELLFSDGKIHTARIRYQSGELRVYLDDFREPILRTGVALPRAFHAGSGEAWVGFTAATGADFQTHDILSWTFFSGFTGDHASRRIAPAPEPGRGAEAAGLPSEPAAFTGKIETIPPGQITGPVRGPMLLTLPLGTALPWRIEASTNLVDWEPVTDPTFHFTDPDATRFNHRFYRVIER